MSGKFLAFLTTIYIILILWCGSLDMQTNPGTYTGVGYNDNQQPTTVLSYLLNFKNAVQSVNIFGGIPLPMPNSQYFAALFALLTLQFSVFSAGNELGWWIIMSPWSIMAVISGVMLFVAIIRGNVTWGT